MRAIEICFIDRDRRHISNPLTTLVLAPFVIAPQIVAVLLWDQNGAAFLAILIFLALFLGSYAIMLNRIRNWRARVENQSTQFAEHNFWA